MFLFSGMEHGERKQKGYKINIYKTIIPIPETYKKITCRFTALPLLKQTMDG